MTYRRWFKNAVLLALNNYIDLVCNLKETINEMISSSVLEYNQDLNRIRKVEIKKELEKYNNLLNETIKDYENNIISSEDFEYFKKKYLYEINKLNIEYEGIDSSNLNKNSLDWIKDFGDDKKIAKVTRDVITEFINNIYVDENKNIEIDFKFKEQYKDALKYLKSKEKMV